jgi:hypothetical protein
LIRKIVMTKKKNLAAVILAAMLAVFLFGAADAFAQTDVTSELRAGKMVSML